MIVVEKRCYCDRCNKEVASEKELYKVSVPTKFETWKPYIDHIVNEYGQRLETQIGNVEIDLCNECREHRILCIQDFLEGDKTHGKL